MSFSFADYNKTRKDRTAALENKLQGKDKGNVVREEDDGYWKISADEKTGAGYAIIRFLPSIPEEADEPFIKYWSHSFKGPTGLSYIEKSLNSIGLIDPVSEANQKLWNSGSEANKKIASSRKRNLHYVSNIYVISDPANPENEGKVFLYRYGQMIMNKIMLAKTPPEGSKKPPVDAFDLIEGANFEMTITGLGRDRDYSACIFERPAPLFKTEAEFNDVLSQIKPLQPILALSNFKTYDQLKERLEKVLAEGSTGSRAEDLPETPAPRTKAREATPPPEDDMPPFDMGEDDDETLAFFESLTKD